MDLVRTEVINIADAPFGWSDDPQYVYIGRPSPWGNPFSVLRHGRHVAIAKFTAAISPRMAEVARRELRGRTLVCYCKPLSCHGDVLAAIADSGSD